MACTGYRNSFPFFEHPDVCEDVVCAKSGLKMKDIATMAKNPRLLYKQVRCAAVPPLQSTSGLLGPRRTKQSRANLSP